MNTTDTHPTPNVPLPAGATSDGWDPVTDDGNLVRSLEWSTHDSGKIAVSVDGSQDDTGSFTRGISFYGASEGKAMTAVQARELAAALIDAAAELDKLDGAYPVDSATRGCCNGIGRHRPDCR